jgi:hypothetical protein
MKQEGKNCDRDNFFDKKELIKNSGLIALI